MPKCVICGDEFKPNKNHRHATCSKIECKRENKRRTRCKREGREAGDISARVCVVCGETFSPSHPKQVACSKQSCKLTYRNAAAVARYNATRDKGARECPICKRRYLPRFENQRTCGGARCMTALNKMKVPKETRTCANCGDEFQAFPSEARRFCTRVCADEHKVAAEKARLAKLVVCPFPSMTTGITGLGSWDCPEMDPFGAGHYQVRLDVCEAAERRAAA